MPSLYRDTKDNLYPCVTCEPLDFNHIPIVNLSFQITDLKIVEECLLQRKQVAVALIRFFIVAIEECSFVKLVRNLDNRIFEEIAYSNIRVGSAVIRENSVCNCPAVNVWDRSILVPNINNIFQRLSKCFDGQSKRNLFTGFFKLGRYEHLKVTLDIIYHLLSLKPLPKNGYIILSNRIDRNVIIVLLVRITGHILQFSLQRSREIIKTPFQICVNLREKGRKLLATLLQTPPVFDVSLISLVKRSICAIKWPVITKCNRIFTFSDITKVIRRSEE